ncbi:ArsR family transcriptional regulator [Methanocaldococcus fervens]|nr:ArsR family transcriptional regulator [Methanocaldococcus fervens]
MIRKTLMKKNVDKILELLEEEGEMFFGQLQRKTGINPSNLTLLLSELLLEGLVSKTEKSDYEGGRVKSYYSITERGKEALKILKLLKTFEKLKDNQALEIHFKVIDLDSQNSISEHG